MNYDLFLNQQKINFCKSAKVIQKKLKFLRDALYVLPRRNRKNIKDYELRHKQEYNNKFNCYWKKLRILFLIRESIKIKDVQTGTGNKEKQFKN